jgi:hypothetical protein
MSQSEVLLGHVIRYVVDSVDGVASFLVMLPVNVSSRILHMPMTSSAKKFPRPFEKLVGEGLLSWHVFVMALTVRAHTRTMQVGA